MFNVEEFKKPETDVITLLSKMSDQDLRGFAERDFKHGMTLLPVFAKYRNEKEFMYLIERLSPFTLELILPKLFSVISRGPVKSEDSQKKMNTLHMILAHQSFDSISSLRNFINTSVLYEALTIENMVAQDERVSWRKIISLNKNLKSVTSPKGTDNQCTQAESLTKAFEDFINLVDNCRSLVSNQTRTFEVSSSKFTLQLCMYYRDKRQEYKDWSLLHFIFIGTHNKAVDVAIMRENASKFIRNLNPTILRHISRYTCNDLPHSGCNLLHFALLYVENMDDIQTLCHRADVETFNKWLCERARPTFRYKEVGLRNLSALQMMLLHLNLASLKSVIAKITPKTFYFALQFDTAININSDNTLSAQQLLEKNPNIKPGPALDDLKQQIYGICLFYELYHYFDVLKDKRKDELESRKAWVKKLMHFIENPPQDYVFCTGLNNMYEVFKPFDKVLLTYCALRPFKEIINDICVLKKVSIVKDSYHACKTLYHQFFMPEAMPIELHQAKPSSSKKVKISTQDNEIIEFKKEQGNGF